MLYAKVMMIQRNCGLKEALKAAREYLKDDGISGADADELFCSACSISKQEVFAHPERILAHRQAVELASLLRQRRKGIPLQYLLGEAWFCGRRFRIEKGVFIPRPETEILAEIAANRAKEYARAADNVRVLDICTGSGCIAITIAAECDSAAVTAVDKSARAVQLAKRNAEALGVSACVGIYRGDLFPKAQGKYHLITCNPPYIAAADMAGLQREVKREPRLALAGGRDGLDHYRRILKKAACCLEKGGTLLLELGYGQADAVCALFPRGCKILIHNDFNGIPRVLEAVFE
ncbi:MAG: peptide chain release factor N(5)-glutamine methyltransferase [Bacillota bacterium]|nr:peptide chain release factor N(5)-glutamine methyltransferase [Bacillota bacterium]